MSKKPTRPPTLIRKSYRQLVEEAQQRSFAEEIEHNKRQSETFIERGEKANQALIKERHNNPILEQEIESAAIYK